MEELPDTERLSERKKCRERIDTHRSEPCVRKEEIKRIPQSSVINYRIRVAPEVVHRVIRDSYTGKARCCKCSDCCGCGSDDQHVVPDIME